MSAIYGANRLKSLMERNKIKVDNLELKEGIIQPQQGITIFMLTVMWMYC